MRMMPIVAGLTARRGWHEGRVERGEVDGLAMGGGGQSGRRGGRRQEGRRPRSSSRRRTGRQRRRGICRHVEEREWRPLVIREQGNARPARDARRWARRIELDGGKGETKSTLGIRVSEDGRLLSMSFALSLTEQPSPFLPAEADFGSHGRHVHADESFS
jgi:hypothetical protein